MKKLSLLILAGLAQLSFAQDMQLRKLIPNKNILIGATVNQWVVANDLGKPHYSKKASYKLVSERKHIDIECAIVPKEFNCLTAENCMKTEVISPEKGKFDFVLADQFMEYAEKYGMAVIGHAPMWHTQLAKWMCRDKDGNLVSKEELKKNIHDYIFTVYGRYRGRVKGWDVVNEAIEDDGSYRNNDFYKILGEEWIDWSFKCAMEADPNVELYYNDFSMAAPGRRATVVNLIKRLKSKGLRIDAVGMQTHIGMDFPKFKEYEKSMQAFIAAGVDIHLTETDISILPNPYTGADVATRFQYTPDKDPYKDGVPEKALKAWQKRYKDLFALVNKYSDHVKRVTFWGVTDATSWKNDFPIHGRTDYPLPFGRDGKFKL